MLSLSAPVVAQDNKAAIDEAVQLVKSKADAKEIKSFAKKYKKNGEVLTGLARAFYEQQDTAMARVYAEQASGLKYAPAYVLLGDIAALADDGGVAGQMYQQAMYFDPKYPEAYIKYATMYSKIDPNGALQKLEDLRVAVPDYPVDLPMAKLYMKANKLDDAIASYDKWYTSTDYSKKEPGDVAGYALIHHMKKNYDKSMQVVKEASEKYPRSSSINRIGLMNTVQMKQFEEALFWGDRLFNKSDSANFNDFDFTNYAQAHIGVGKFDEAIELYRKGMDVSKADKDAVNNLRKEISDAYMQKGDLIRLYLSIVFILITLRRRRPVTIVHLPRCTISMLPILRVTNRRLLSRRLTKFTPRWKSCLPTTLMCLPMCSIVVERSTPFSIPILRRDWPNLCLKS